MSSPPPPPNPHHPRRPENPRTFTLRLAQSDADDLDKATIDLRAGVGRRVDRAEVMRELVALFLEDQAIRDRVTTGLQERALSRGSGRGLGL